MIKTGRKLLLQTENNLKVLQADISELMKNRREKLCFVKIVVLRSVTIRSSARIAELRFRRQEEAIREPAVRGTAEDISRADITREGSRQAGVLPDL